MSTYWHESEAARQEQLARDLENIQKRRGLPPHPDNPIILGPDSAPGPAPQEPLERIRRKLAPKTPPREGEPAPVLHVWAGEVDFIIAESAEEAAQIARSEFGSVPGEGGAAEDYELWPDEKPFTYIRDVHGAPEVKDKRPAREFIAEFGKGYFASSEW